MTSAKCAKIEDIFTLLIKDRFHLVERRLVTRRHDVQQPVLGMGRGAPERGVDHPCTLRRQIGTNLAGGGRNGCTKVNQHGPIFDPC